MKREANKDCINELTNIAQSYTKENPNSEDGYQMEALVYKQFGMLDKQKEILEYAVKQPIATPRCAIMLADIEFRERYYDKSLKNFQKAIAESNQMKTEVHNGYLHVMSALCKIASAEQKKVDLNKKDILDIYGDFNVALSYADNLNSNYKDILANKATHLLDTYDVPIPKKDKRLSKFVEELKMGK